MLKTWACMSSNCPTSCKAVSILCALLQLEALKCSLRQMAEEKDTAAAEALGPMQKQLQVHSPSWLRAFQAASP